MGLHSRRGGVVGGWDSLLAAMRTAEKSPKTDSKPVPIVLATLHQAKNAVCLGEESPKGELRSS